MRHRPFLLPLRLFACLLIVGAVLTGTWQQNRLFQLRADERPVAPVERIAEGMATAQRSGEERRAGTDRPCPRLLHLDATLTAALPNAARTGTRIPSGDLALLQPEETPARVATPPPRA